MRPQGIIRVALRESAQRLAGEKGGASWREIASSATNAVPGGRVQRGVAPKLARQTVKNMVYAGELVEVGREKPAGSTHWHALYAPPEPPAEMASGSDFALRSLNDLVSGWARRGG